jgi:hypothetical protein
MSLPDAFSTPGFGGTPSSLEFRQRGNLAELDRQLYALWELGRNLILAWCPGEGGILVLVSPHLAVAAYVNAQPGTAHGHSAAHDFIVDLLAGNRRFTSRQMRNAAHLLGIEPKVLRLRQPLGESPAETEAVNGLVKRYSVSFVRGRAAALFDIVGFSLLTPFEQMTQLNSLSCSLNAAHSHLLARRLHVNFARSSTGDGFYIWNRDTGQTANTNLYHFMHLVLADNAIAALDASERTVPLLRAAFHLGSCYEFHHAEGLNPTIYSDIVGDVTIGLARMVEHALPGQILVGDFTFARDDVREDAERTAESLGFIELTQHTLNQLSGLELSGDAIEAIKCYLTGRPRSDGSFTVRKLAIHDKHGITRYAYNAKVNIHCRGGRSILLGLEDRQLRNDGQFGVTASHVISPGRPFIGD